VLASPLSRLRWLLASVAVGAASVLVVLGATAVVTFGSFAAVGDTASGWRAVGQILAQGPASLVFVGIAALLLGALPRLSVGLAWGLFGAAAVLGLLGGLLRLPQWVRNVSPLSSVPPVPFESMGDAVLNLGLAAGVAVVLAALGAALFRRRDVPA
jgi:ABC-2 type transport system permease protein